MQVPRFQQQGQEIRFNCTRRGVYYKVLSKGSRTLQIAKVLRGDHRTIKKYVAASHRGRKKCVQPKFNKLNDRQLKQIHCQVAKIPLASSRQIFDNCDMPKLSRATLCKALREVALVIR